MALFPSGRRSPRIFACDTRKVRLSVNLRVLQTVEQEMKSILVVSKHPDAFRVIDSCFGSEYEVDSAINRDEALSMVAKKPYALIFIDVELLRHTEVAHKHKVAMEMFWSMSSSSEIIVMSQQETIREAVSAVKAGATDYVMSPIHPEEVKYVVESIYQDIATRTELDFLRSQFWQSDSLDVVQTKNHGMKDVLAKVRLVAPTKTTVLLIGETGTGKSLLARLIHRHSNRRDDQFIPVHCGAIPDTLLESELFGHEKGAFTGALRRRLGKFEIAHGGTVFLDEIGTLTPSAQIKLLQVLQDGTFQRVGGEDTIIVDVRVISATNVNLKQMVDEATFRKDLYYRLNIFPIEIPALCKRTEDIPYLANLFLKRQDRLGEKSIHSIHPEVVEAFRKYPWPGNIRELENVIERAYVLATAHMLTKDDFPSEIVGSEPAAASVSVDSTLSLSEIRRNAIEVAEAAYLRELLGESQGKVRLASEKAGITPRQFSKLIGRYGIRKEEFKSSRK